MVFPLFAMALLWDRLRLGERRLIKARPVSLRIAGRTLVTNTVNVAVAVVFAVMGGFIIYLAQSERMTGGPGFQAGFGRFLSRVFARIEAWVRTRARSRARPRAARPRRGLRRRHAHRPAPTSDPDEHHRADPAHSCHHDTTTSMTDEETRR